ncbi:MAG: AraC family transcriptional regulator [Burkholderiaceae bacterium]
MQSATGQLLDSFPLFRSRSADEARDLVGRVFSPHRLAVRGTDRALEVRHNQVRFDQLGINVLSYGAEVEIDPGERGDFYLLQLPLRGQARMHCGRQEAVLDPGVMGVLHPRTPTLMHWSGDCAMLLLQVPSHALQDHLGTRQARGQERLATLTLSRQDPAVAAWWQSVLDLTRNLHHHGRQWLGQPKAQAAMETFLLAGLSLLHQSPECSGPGVAAVTPASQDRCLRRARDYIHAHAHEGLALADIAAAACVSPRTLEAAFRRRYDQSPLAYARGVQLDRVHAALGRAALENRPLRVTDVASQHGFAHMGRFAGYYKQRFGCAPSETLRQR